MPEPIKSGLNKCTTCEDRRKQILAMKMTKDVWEDVVESEALLHLAVRRAGFVQVARGLPVPRRIVGVAVPRLPAR